ncbi:MAG: ABC transporter ATP-binding protein [Candidatus Omnitrophota bacterium]
MPALRLENVSKVFGKTKALSEINLAIEEGTFCVILGPSGCGKSTLLNLIAGLEEVTEGKIFSEDKDITGLAPQKRNMAMVFQSYALYPHLSVFENIAFGLRLRGEGTQEIKAKVENVSRSLNIEDKLSRFPKELSGGERQRVATGRAIVRNPQLFLFDEPLSNLDARLRMELRSEFIRLHQRLHKTIIYVTHDQVEALVLGEMVVVLKGGMVQQVSTPLALYSDPANLFVAGFIGTPPMNILRLKVKKAENTLKLVREELVLDAPGDSQGILEKYVDQEIFFGFRPSAAKIDPRSGIKGEVVFTETIAEVTYARIKIHPEIEINIKVDEPVIPQSLVRLAIEEAKSYLFGRSGERI